MAEELKTAEKWDRSVANLLQQAAYGLLGGVALGAVVAARRPHLGAAFVGLGLGSGIGSGYQMAVQEFRGARLAGCTTCKCGAGACQCNSAKNCATGCKCGSACKCGPACKCSSGKPVPAATEPACH
eukprot:TRINITY_DN5357_c0_g1_i1.p3 TRINITY_DN5357_c0_g1~~TRINITY_DN5357_c0_g1_i1.p3  ORF type:complete len:127 (-),score=20.56 TRINITY_DN5357_c0_g1_i1:28-408(-)